MEFFSAVIIYVLMIVGFFLLGSLGDFIKKQKDRYDWRGFDENGRHKNGTLYNDEGYDKDGYNREGYNRLGYNKNGYNRYGYDASGYNVNGFDKDGYDKEGYDQNGFDKQGYNREGYNRDGYNKLGYNHYGYNKTSVYVENATTPDDYDKDGYNPSGFNKSGYHKNGTFYNDDGYDKDGYDEYGYNKSGYDRDGYNRNGYNKFGQLCREYDSSNNKNNFTNDALPPKHIRDYFQDGYYVSFDPKETTNAVGKKYHTHLDCYLSWSNYALVNFDLEGCWYRVTERYVQYHGLVKCKFCEERDKMITVAKPDKTLTKELEPKLLAGKKVLHKKFGQGYIEHVDKSSDKIKVTFANGPKEFILSTAMENYLELVD